MNLVKLGTSRLGATLLTAICQNLPRRQAYQVADGLAEHVSRQPDSAMNLALRQNLSVVMSCDLDHPRMDEVLAKLYANTLRAYVDLFCVMREGGKGLDAIMRLDEQMLATARQVRRDGTGVLLVGAHTSGFDLLILGLGQHFPEMQVLTNAEPVGGMLTMNEIRWKLGVQVTPISRAALRQAIAKLNSGGIVALAVDLPDPSGETLDFFGRPCRLPVGHARLALSTGAQLLVGASSRIDEGRYRGEGTLRTGAVPASESRTVRARALAQDCLAYFEEFIRAHPDQWFMPHPLWSCS